MIPLMAEDDEFLRRLIRFFWQNIRFISAQMFKFISFVFVEGIKLEYHSVKLNGV